MNEEQRNRHVMALLSDALELEAGAARQKFLDQVCTGDPELRSELEALLAEEGDGDFLETPAAARWAGVAAGSSAVSIEELLEPPKAAPPDQLGPYRIVKTLGRGGMGTVYLGQQEKPVRRRVALKVIDSIHDRQQRKRFAAECQALARLSHPNIASLYEVGTTGEGHPFVVMELIEGTAITTWCDEHRLGLRDRIELFFGVCAAVRHAHENDVLHRDIKPSNILVTHLDDRPVAKVIDFGIARALGDEPLLGDTVTTLEHHLVGSPAYMSPEAVVSGKQNLDHRCDIYSMGLVLYQLIAGVLPFDVEEQTIASLLRRAVREDLPVPSVRFGALDPVRREEIAAARNLRPDALVRRARGDLDAIITKAIARDREKRYNSAADLAVDLGCHLSYEPVEAVPQSTQYQVRKFILRHRGAVAAAVLSVVALITGITGTSMALVRAWRAEAQALNNLSRAQQAVDDFLTDVSESDLLEAPGVQPVRKRLLERALRYYEGFIEQHQENPTLRLELAKASLRVGRINDELGTQQLALPAYQRAIEILEAQAPDDDGEARYHLADATHRAAWAYYHTGQAQQAFEVGIRALELQEELVKDFPDNTTYRELLAKGLTDRSDALEVTGRDEAAVAMSGRAVGILQELDREHAESGRFRAELAMAHARYGGFLYRVERYADGLQSQQAALEIYRELLARDPNDRANRARYAEGLNSFGESHLALGNVDNAQFSFAQAQEIWNSLREEFPSIIAYPYGHSMSLKNLGRAHGAAGELLRAAEFQGRAAELLRELRLRNPSSLMYRLQLAHQLNGLGEIYRQADNSAAAIDTLQEAAGLFADFVEQNPTVEDAKRSLSQVLQRLAESLRDAGRSEEALRQQTRRLAVLGTVQGDPSFEAELRGQRIAAAKRLARWLLADAPVGSSEASSAALEAIETTLAALKDGTPAVEDPELAQLVERLKSAANPTALS